jgi:hypothetical protein
MPLALKLMGDRLGIVIKMMASLLNASQRAGVVCRVNAHNQHVMARQQLCRLPVGVAPARQIGEQYDQTAHRIGRLADMHLPVTSTRYVCCARWSTDKRG